MSGGEDSRGGDSRGGDSRGEGSRGGDRTRDGRELLAEMGALRRRARADRHAYWFPLVLFGLLAFASLPFYLESWPVPSGVGYSPDTTMPALGGMVTANPAGLASFWLAALPGGLLATEAWYWWRSRRAGLTMPHRAALITTAVLTLAAIVIPLGWHVSWLHRVAALIPADLLIRGTLPLLLIGLGLLVLAWTERSRGLAGIALIYSLAALLGSLYDEENLLARVGWVLSERAEELPNVILPAAILLISGVAVLAAGRRPARPLVEVIRP